MGGADVSRHKSPRPNDFPFRTGPAPLGGPPPSRGHTRPRVSGPRGDVGKRANVGELESGPHTRDACGHGQAAAASRIRKVFPNPRHTPPPGGQLPPNAPSPPPARRRVPPTLAARPRPPPDGGHRRRGRRRRPGRPAGGRGRRDDVRRRRLDRPAARGRPARAVHGVRVPRDRVPDGAELCRQAGGDRGRVPGPRRPRRRRDEQRPGRRRGDRGVPAAPGGRLPPAARPGRRAGGPVRGDPHAGGLRAGAGPRRAVPRPDRRPPGPRGETAAGPSPRT